MSAPSLLVVAPMREELWAARRRGGLRCEVVGEGARRAPQGLRRVLDKRDADALVVIGVAGALTPDLEPESVVVGERVIAGDLTFQPDPDLLRRALAVDGVRPATLVPAAGLVATAEEKAALAANAGAATAVVDLESASLAAVAEERGVPWVVIRCVSDSAAEGLLPFVLSSARPDGSISRPKVIAKALLKPRRLGVLRAVARRMRRCSEALADAVWSMRDLPRRD